MGLQEGDGNSMADDYSNASVESRKHEKVEADPEKIEANIDDDYQPIKNSVV